MQKAKNIPLTQKEAFALKNNDVVWLKFINEYEVTPIRIVKIIRNESACDDIYYEKFGAWGINPLNISYINAILELYKNKPEVE